MEDSLRNFLSEHWLSLALIIFVAYFFRKFAMLAITRIIRHAIRPDKFGSAVDEKQREDTLVSIINASLRIGIWIIAGMLLLAEIGVNIAPLLAGAGIAGVALGFGAQSLVKDFLAGIFIIVENQYRVGDVIRVNRDVSGVVEHMTLRETVLRDLDGMVHHIPNGFINIATNMTMEFANVNLDVPVDYSSDLDKVEKLVNKVGLELTADDNWKDKIIEPPEFLRVNEFADSAVVIKIVGRTKPMQQWAVTGELRKRLKKAFDSENIKIPLPQRVVHQAKK